MNITPLASMAAALLAASALSSVAPTPAAAAPGFDLPEALRASAPQPVPADQAKAISGLIGTWKVDYVDISKTGVVRRRTGQFIAGWVLDGRAMQDVWIVDPSGTRTTREVYTDLWWFDPKTGTWPAAFFDPEHASVANLTSEPAAADRIVMHSPDLGAADTRWSFVDIRPDSFGVRDEASDDGGKTWRLRSEYRMTRQTAVASAR